MIDSPVFPDELELLPALLEQAGFPLSRAARDARRLGSPARAARVPGGVARRAPRRTAARLRAPSRAPRSASCATSTRRHYVDAPRAAGARLGSRRCRCPGACGLGDERELELHPADGHTADGMAIWIGWAARAGLRRLPLAGRDPDARRPARRLPGDARAARAAGRRGGRTSSPATAARSARRRRAALLAEDRAYLEALRGASRRRRRCPPAGATAEQRRLHAANVARLRPAAP